MFQDNYWWEWWAGFSLLCLVFVDWFVVWLDDLWVGSIQQYPKLAMTFHAPFTPTHHRRMTARPKGFCIYIQIILRKTTQPSSTWTKQRKNEKKLISFPIKLLVCWSLKRSHGNQLRGSWILQFWLVVFKLVWGKSCALIITCTSLKMTIGREFDESIPTRPFSQWHWHLPCLNNLLFITRLIPLPSSYCCLSSSCLSLVMLSSLRSRTKLVREERNYSSGMGHGAGLLLLFNTSLIRLFFY